MYNFDIFGKMLKHYSKCEQQLSFGLIEYFQVEKKVKKPLLSLKSLFKVNNYIIFTMH